MKNHWLTFFGGTVKVKVQGAGIERFINALIRSNMAVWNVKRQGSDTVTFMLRLGDIPILRKVKRSFPCKLSFLRGEGVPFLWKRSMKNAGFMIGILLFFVIITILSNIVWGIEIKGATPQTEHNIRKQLDRMGVQVGKSQFFMKDVESIQRELSNSLNNITWVGVVLKGTTYHFQVVEKNAPEKVEETGFQNLVASKKATIVKMFVEEGQTVVSVHDNVDKGQVLVSGYIGKDKHAKLVASKGEIWGQTWYKSNVEIPLESEFHVLTGKEKIKHTIKLWNWEFPIWGFGDNKMKEHVDDKVKHPVKFLKWTLPISYNKTTIREVETGKRTYTKTEALREGKELARNNLKAQLDKDAKIIDEKVLHEKVENGKVVLSLYFQVVENIAIGQPIIQGD
ncbi:sporulation protein YqfD [Falsibacillus pallidus]|uniref:sporulation protein YqfD n=1 Tax=Falsibacillus pallidus TaxID=493781 RepID=UPI003D974917